MIRVRRFFVWVWVTFGLSACAPARPASQPLGGSTQQTSEGTTKRGLDPSKVNAPKVEALFAERVEQAMTRPGFEQAMQELLTSLTNDREVAARGNALFESLGKDPRLAARSEEFQERWSKQPAMVSFVMRLMAEHPDASPDQIGELAEQAISRQTDSPAFDQAFDFAVDRLFERPRLKAAFDSFGDALSKNQQFERGIANALRSIDYGPLAKRVIAFNGGTEPDIAGATQILTEHAFTTDRIEALMLTWLRLPELRSELRGLVSDMLRDPSFRKRVVAVSAQLLAEPEVQQGLDECFALLLEAQPEPAKMKLQFRKTLDTPRVDAIVASFVLEVQQDPALQALGSRLVERVASSPYFAASVQQFVSDW